MDRVILHPGLSERVEAEISEKFAQASKVYADNPTALNPRAMNMLYEAIKEKGRW